MTKKIYPPCHKTKLAYESIFCTSQKLTLFAQGIARTAWHRMAVGCRKFHFPQEFSTEKLAEKAAMAGRYAPCFYLNLLEILVELSGIEPLTSTMPL